MIDETSGVILSYGDGDTCLNRPYTPDRTTIINLYCSAAPETAVISVSEYEFCVYTIEMTSPSACSTNPPSPSASPSPTFYAAGYNPCNSIKVPSFPFTYYTNLQLGNPYNGTCLGGESLYSQFYLVNSPVAAVITASTCSTAAAFDSVIRVYQSVLCSNLGPCIAENDDGCPSSTLSSVTVSVQANRDYYFEVRSYGTSPAPYYTINFSM
jgi:hypothetical protein